MLPHKHVHERRHGRQNDKIRLQVARWASAAKSHKSRKAQQRTYSSCVPAGSLMPSHLVVLQLSLTHNAGVSEGKQRIFDMRSAAEIQPWPAFGTLPRRPSKVRVATQRSTFLCNAATASANRMRLTGDCESISQVLCAVSCTYQYMLLS